MRKVLHSGLLLAAFAGVSGCSFGTPFGMWSDNSSTPFSATPTPASGGSSWLSPKAGLAKVGSTVGTGVQKARSGLGAVAGSLMPKSSTAPTGDPTSLNNKVTSVGTELHISAAALYEAQGNLAAAQEQYQRALQAAPQDATVWLGLARLQERQNRPEEALRGYREAARLDPNNAAVHSDLGMCLARQGQLPPALESVGRAVQLQPGNSTYRNNLARLLVEAGRPEEAFSQLSAAMTPAHAHYNLGYLLYERGDTAGATQQFTAAAQLDPNLAQARQMLATLQGQAQQVQGQWQAVQGEVQSQYNRFQAVSQQVLGPAGQAPAPR